MASFFDNIGLIDRGENLVGACQQTPSSLMLIVGHLGFGEWCWYMNCYELWKGSRLGFGASTDGNQPYVVKVLESSMDHPKFWAELELDQVTWAHGLLIEQRREVIQ